MVPDTAERSEALIKESFDLVLLDIDTCRA